MARDSIQLTLYGKFLVLTPIICNGANIFYVQVLNIFSKEVNVLIDMMCCLSTLASLVHSAILWGLIDPTFFADLFIIACPAIYHLFKYPIATKILHQIGAQSSPNMQKIRSGLNILLWITVLVFMVMVFSPMPTICKGCNSTTKINNAGLGDDVNIVDIMFYGAFPHAVAAALTAVLLINTKYRMGELSNAAQPGTGTSRGRDMMIGSFLEQWCTSSMVITILIAVLHFAGSQAPVPGELRFLFPFIASLIYVLLYVSEPGAFFVLKRRLPVALAANDTQGQNIAAQPVPPPVPMAQPVPPTVPVLPDYNQAMGYNASNPQGQMYPPYPPAGFQPVYQPQPPPSPLPYPAYPVAYPPAPDPNNMGPYSNTSAA